MLLSTIAVTLFGRSPAGSDEADPDLHGLGFLHERGDHRHVRDFREGVSDARARLGHRVAVGVGRGGSVLAPIIAGFLFTFDPLADVAAAAGSR